MQIDTSMTGSEYAYGYGRLGVLQQRLLEKSDIDRLLGAHGEAELLNVLQDIKFTAPVCPLEDLKDFLPAMELWLRTQLEHLSPPDKHEVFHILWLREDQPVMSHMLKQFHGHVSGLTELPENSVTAYDTAHMKREIFENDRGALPEDAAHFVEEIKAKKNIKPQEIDHAVSLFIAEKQTQLAKDSGSLLIQRYVRHLIDLQNIRTARRLRPGEDTSDKFLPGGEIDPRRLSTNAREIALLIHSSTLPSSLADGMKEGDDAALILERSLNKGLAHDIAEMRSLPLSVEPIFAYGVIALSQILMVRTVLIGKHAGLTGEEVAQMLPPIFSTAYQNS